jgi:hypothetical protein
MSEPSGKSGAPIVEHKPNEIEPSALSLALERRIRQQEILAELGVSALQGASFSQLLDDTVRAPDGRRNAGRVLQGSRAHSDRGMFSGPRRCGLGAGHRWSNDHRG